MPLPILMVRVSGFEKATVAGHFYWHTYIPEEGAAPIRSIAMCLPRVGVISIPVEGPNAWQWDGNEEHPTLSPSVFANPPSDPPHTRPSWHGFVQAGRLTECA